MTQRRLENLAIMSTEPNILRETDFTAIISNFAVAKSRKVRVWSLTLDFWVCVGLIELQVGYMHDSYTDNDMTIDPPLIGGH